MSFFPLTIKYPINLCKHVSIIRKFSKSKIVESATAKGQDFESDSWKTVIGLEVHAQLLTKSKLFSASTNQYAALPNDEVSLFDAAIPGTLPVLNQKCVELGVVAALSLSCKINPASYFDRKHYFYSDLPAGYQITQQRKPLAVNGCVEFLVYQPGVHKKPYLHTCKIKQIQLEQDSGKSMHNHEENQSYIDLNRAGIGLIEIVFEPDLIDCWEASSLVQELCVTLRRAGCCSCKLEEGTLRVDANVSVHKEGENFGVRTEIKNLNSLQSIEQAISYERLRQINILNAGGSVLNETLTWSRLQKETISLRDKEEKQDYRFMPEPCLLPLRILVDENSIEFHKNIFPKENILDFRHLKDKLRLSLQTLRRELMEVHKVDAIKMYNLQCNEKVVDCLLDVLTEKPTRKEKLVYEIIMIYIMRVLYENNLDFDNRTLSASDIGELVDLFEAGTINHVICKKITQAKISGETMSPKEMVEKLNWTLITDPIEIEKYCAEVIDQNPEIVAQFKDKRQRKIALTKLIDKVLILSDSRASTKTIKGTMINLLQK